jgi:hypothetical membrane protein
MGMGSLASLPAGKGCFAQRRHAVWALVDQHPFAGPLLWILGLQFYIVQYAVIRAWHSPYSLKVNLISDLGNTVCGNFRGGYVCSPLHAWMNASLVILGVCNMLGALLFAHLFHRHKGSTIGFAAIALGEGGTLLSGLLPENVVPYHFIAAGVAFVLVNAGMVMLSLAGVASRAMRVYTVLSGGIGLVAISLYAIHVYAGLGPGGMERVAAYVPTTWFIVFGAYCLYKYAGRGSSSSEPAA